MQTIRRTPRHRNRRALDVHLRADRLRAFTIAELTIVVLIMSIFAAVTAPTFLDSLLFHRVETAARRVKADIEYCRQLSRLTSAPQVLTFTGGGAYTISGAKSLDNAIKAYAVDLRKSPYSLDSAMANFASRLTLSFDGYGTPSSGGSVTLTAKTHQCTVSVDSVTGAVTITSNHAKGGTSQVSGS